MAHIEVENASLELPVFEYGDQSLGRQALSAVAVGGRLKKPRRNRMGVLALSEVTATFRSGDRVGLIGGNGSGKTSLLRLLAGIYEPTSGTVRRRGSIAPLLDVSFGMEAECTGYENILLRGLHLGLRRRELKARMEEIAAFSDLGSFLDMPLRTYSSGMYFRLAFAVSTCVDADVLLMDEWIGAGDSAFLARVEAALKGFVERSGLSVLASHDLDLVRRTCNHAVVMEHGGVAFAGAVDEAIDYYVSSWQPQPAAAGNTEVQT